MATLLLLSALLEHPLVSFVLLLVGYLLGRGARGFGTSYKAVKAWLSGWVSRQQGQRPGEHEEQQLLESGRQNAADELSAGALAQPDEPAETTWYIGTEEAQRVVERTSQQDAGEEQGWKHMMDREMQGVFKYSAYRRATPSGLTEYRTITTAPNTSPMELMEFLLDDDARRGWEGFLAKATVLEQGAERSREQVVRWVRRFPFHFLTDREYVIARKVWSQGPAGRLQVMARTAPGTPLYAVTKGLDEHPAAPKTQALVRTSGFYSCWRCRAVPDPWGGAESAAEVVLLHQENIHVPEYLARTAVSMGMSKFVKELVGGLMTFTEARRSRGVDPHQPDPLAYGHDFARVSTLHLEPVGSGHDTKRALEDGELDAAADFGTEQNETGISAAESLHLHPHHRPHRLRRLLTSKSASSKQQQPGTKDTSGFAPGVTSPVPRSVVTSGNVTPVSSSGQASPVARSETDSPADMVARVRAGRTTSPQKPTTVATVLQSSQPTPFGPAANEAAAAWLRGGAEPSTRRRDFTSAQQLSWHRKLAMGIMGAATVAGVRQLLQQQHVAVTGSDRRRAPIGRRSSSGHRRALSDAATMLRENRFQFSDESTAEGSDREQPVRVLAARRLRGRDKRQVASFILPQEVFQQMSDNEE